MPAAAERLGVEGAALGEVENEVTPKTAARYLYGLTVGQSGVWSHGDCGRRGAGESPLRPRCQEQNADDCDDDTFVVFHFDSSFL